MENNEALYRALGSIEGKMDLLLANDATNRSAINARLDDHSKRLTALETWKSKATAILSVLFLIGSGLWSVFTFIVK